MLKNDLFKWTLVTSIVFHLFVVLGISFVMPDQAKRPLIGPPLKITLVTNISENAPQDATTVAQANSVGEQQLETNAPLLNQVSQPLQNQNQEPNQANFTESFFNTSENEAELSDQVSERKKDSEESELDREQLTESINLAYLNAQSLPKETYVSANAKENKYAAYIEKWRLLVERVGNLNYPEAAKQQKLQGSLVLDTAIRADGSIEKVRILQPSGYKILDDAAIRIVHIASPFDRFPDDISQDIDILHIVRTWEFTHEKLVSHVFGTE